MFDSMHSVDSLTELSCSVHFQSRCTVQTFGSAGFNVFPNDPTRSATDHSNTNAAVRSSLGVVQSIASSHIFTLSFPIQSIWLEAQCEQSSTDQ